MGVSECNEWVFTFGFGQPSAGHCVRIKGTFDEARAKMFKKYGTEWSMQYSAEEWAQIEQKPHRWYPIETEIPF